MKIHRVVQMLGATTSTGKLADDMYDLGHKDYYSEAEDRYVPISHMDFQHMVRAFVKLNEETDMENQRLVQQLEHDETVVSKEAYQAMKERADLRSYEAYKYKKLADDKTVVSKEAYQVMWDNCEKLKKNLQEQEDKILELTTKVENLQERCNAKDDIMESLRDRLYDASSLQGCYYTFTEVPQDSEGNAFIKNCKKYLNRDSYKIRVRGQHLKPELYGKGRAYHGANMEDSTHMRVYIDTKKGD